MRIIYANYTNISNFLCYLILILNLKDKNSIVAILLLYCCIIKLFNINGILQISTFQSNSVM